MGVQVMFKRITDFFAFSLLLCFLCFQFASADVSFRSSRGASENQLFVALDFKLAPGEQISSSASDGGFSITWKNSSVVSEYWPDSSVDGYSGDFSAFYELRIDDKSKPVSYDVFYVVCGDACTPVSESGELVQTDDISPEELKKLQLPESHPFDFAMMLAFGFLGGLILNFMPCVFPIISLKAFSIAKISGQSSGVIRRHAVFISLGILSLFMLLGIPLKLFSSLIPGLGWGFYMQEPVFVFFLLLVFLACAVHFGEIFQFKLPVVKHRATSSQTYVSSFFSGIFSGIASSACVGPFAGVALAGAVLYGNLLQSILILFSVAFGVAFPFVFISIFPSLVHRFPKPGSWLNTFKRFMGYAMFLSCVWPFSILLDQVGFSAAICLLIILIIVVFCLNEFTNAKMPCARRFLSVLIFALLLSGFYKTAHHCQSLEIDWQNYSKVIFDDAVSKKRPMFLNFTASWCMNCQFNQRIFSDPDVVDIFYKRGVCAIKCDWTKRDIKITNLMKRYNSISVPLYVYYSGNGQFEVLPSLLTKDLILEVIGDKHAEQ